MLKKSRKRDFQNWQEGYLMKQLQKCVTTWHKVEMNGKKDVISNFEELFVGYQCRNLLS